jgi:hypothetical protein
MGKKKGRTWSVNGKDQGQFCDVAKMANDPCEDLVQFWQQAINMKSQNFF